MKYLKIINRLYNETTQPSKFGTKNWVILNHNRRRTYDKKLQC